jgi:hypothetical protein
MLTFPLELNESQVIISLKGRPRVVTLEPHETVTDVYGTEAVYVTSYPTWANIDALMDVVNTAIQRYQDYQDDF